VSQPTNRTGLVPAPGDLDPALREFWVENPWQIAVLGHNLSSFERNRAYLNVGGKDFLEISHLTGADSDGDGRAVVAADFRNAGVLDLIVRQAGGGPLMLYENRMPRRHYLNVTLRGRESNRQGVGARLTAVAGGQRQVREMFPANGFCSQAPNVVHFGLGEAAAVDTLTVRWPSGKVQVFTGLSADRHVVIDEGRDGTAAVEAVVPGNQIAP
jgi:hypothetical protein